MTYLYQDPLGKTVFSRFETQNPSQLTMNPTRLVTNQDIIFSLRRQVQDLKNEVSVTVHVWATLHLTAAYHTLSVTLAKRKILSLYLLHLKLHLQQPSKHLPKSHGRQWQHKHKICLVKHASIRSCCEYMYVSLFLYLGLECRSTNYQQSCQFWDKHCYREKPQNQMVLIMWKYPLLGLNNKPSSPSFRFVTDPHLPSLKHKL